VKLMLNRLFWTISGILLRLRYRVTVEGAEGLSGLKGPTLVLPNHPAYIDPPLVLSHLRLGTALRPLVFSGIYRLLPLRPLMAMVDAFEVPDLSAQSRDAQAKTLEMIDAVVARIGRGDSFLIYPSGRLQRGNAEVVGSARAVHELLSRCPDLNVVLVRTRGLWGSSFGCAATGAPPSLVPTMLRNLGWALAALLVFLPRRKVTIHVEVLPKGTLPKASREQTNAFLEGWYNVDGPQQPAFVRYSHFFGPTAGHYAAGAALPSIDPATIDPKTIRLVNDLVQGHLGRELDPCELAFDTTLEALGMDSLDRMDATLKVEQQFGFHNPAVLNTLGELWALADGKLSGGAKEEAIPVPAAWFAPPRSTDAPAVLAGTVAEAFVRRALAAPTEPAVADRISGVLPSRRLLVGASLMARRFAAWPEKHVGVMLPASVAADIVFFALHMAGKTPVMMNWTTGPSSLAHGVKVTGTQRIITSKKLVDRLGIEVPGTPYEYLETIRGGIGKAEQLSTLLGTILNSGAILRGLPKQDPDEPAVFLFTSGSESAPKTVPLSHTNLITNIADSLEVLEVTAADSLLGFLPPFHSFGLTGNVLLPHLTGIRSVRHADPTDARGLVETIRAFHPTMLFTTPTFLSYILSVSQEGDLRSLRRIIAGAERCPDSVFERTAALAPEAVILEGYGITECSPVLAANRVADRRRGFIGRPVRNVDIRVVDVDSGEPVATGETGMLLASGPSIFSGYLNHDGPSPFVELEGKQWYRTGDLVVADADNWLAFKGRLKRFLKAGGEMISLPALEEPFSKCYPADENGPKVAVEGIETPGGRQIALFTTFPLTLREASQILLADGLRGVMRLDEVRQIETIPVLGTGKTDYKELRRLVTEAVTGG
jgi:acyl-CoA synthetase (AMP-forming)/AMP-acid ligase II/1-acyl-sn-glycerol-3-phosphate acyltransferase/acyl carrier protein